MQQECLMDTNPVSHTESDTPICGTKDGLTAADNDQPYRFGRQPTVKAPFPFTERQLARLLISRGRVHAELSSEDRSAA
jgi:hypothetical protein